MVQSFFNFQKKFLFKVFQPLFKSVESLLKSVEPPLRWQFLRRHKMDHVAIMYYFLNTFLSKSFTCAAGSFLIFCSSRLIL